MSEDESSTDPAPDGGVVSVDAPATRLHDGGTEGRTATDAADESALARLADSSR